MSQFWMEKVLEYRKAEYDERRRKRIEDLALAIYDAVRETQPSVCMYTNRPERIDGKWEGLDDIGFDGNFDLLRLAEALHERIS